MKASVYCAQLRAGHNYPNPVNISPRILNCMKNERGDQSEKTKRGEVSSGDNRHHDPYCWWERMLESSGCAQLQHQRVWGTCCIHRLQCCAASDSGASRMGSSDHTSHDWGWMWFSGLMIEDLCWELIGCMFSTQTSVDLSGSVVNLYSIGTSEELCVFNESVLFITRVGE